jgi:TolB-like protein/Tfp pilus assembly protein PilF
MTEPAPDTVDLGFLGPFEASRGGLRIALSSRKAQVLLALLAVEPQGVSRDKVAALLWGAQSQSRARHNVRQSLSKIKASLGDLIRSEGEILKLDPARCITDVQEFRSWTVAENAVSLAKCLDLNRGGFLEGVSSHEPELDDWLRATRDRMERDTCAAIDRLVDLLLAGRQFEQAIARLTTRLEIEPACELAYRHLMRIYASTGRRSDALREYQSCRDALARELNASTSPETDALYREILDTEVSRPPSQSEQHRIDAIISSEDKPKVAVLPFENLSIDSTDYFVDGITEDIITALSRFHALHVIARGSSFVYKGQSMADDEVAEALGARYLVRGSMQKSGNRIRINVQLLDGPGGLNVWAQRYDRELTDLFEIQDEITATVASTLAGRVEARQLDRVRKVPEERLDAYDLLLRGKDHHHRFTPEDCAQCIDLFDHAIGKDPEYALAHAWLACGLGQAMVFELDDHESLLERSQAAAETGLALDETDSECHRVLAQVHLLHGDLARAMQHQERALFLNPNDDRSVCAMGEILTFLGQPDQGERWVRKSMTLNPYYPQRYLTHLARALLHQARYIEALDLIAQIGRPRRDDLAYAVVANLHAGSQMAIDTSVNQLRVTAPTFNAEEFLASQFYKRPEDRTLILEALKQADL